MGVPQTVRRHPSSISPSIVGPTAIPAPSLTARITNRVRDFMSVEYSGFYSLEKLYAFQIDRQPGFWLAQVYIWQAAVPTVLIVTGSELLPLSDPSLPWTQNASFFVRLSPHSWVVAWNVNVQAQERIPELRRPLSHSLFVAVLHSLPFTGTVLAIAAIADVFPVPFSTLVPIPPTSLLGLVTRYLSVRVLVNQDPTLKQKVVRFERLVGFVFTLTFTYSVYSFVFRHVDTKLQVAMSVVLFGIKHAAKYRMWQLSHMQVHHDLSNESVACGVHLFHALFTITCLQTANSYETFVIFLSLGIVQEVLTFRYLRRRSREVYAMIQELKSDGLVGEGNSPFLAQWTAQQINEAQPGKEVPPGAAYFRHHLTATQSLRRTHSSLIDSLVIPFQPASPPPPLPSVSQRKALATQAVAQLLHCREVVLLRQFVDIFVPLFYLAFCMLMLLLPNNNRLYFASLSELDWVSLRILHAQVSILVLTKMVAMTALCWLFHVHDQPSGVHQLVFVMRSQRRTMQAWMIINFVQIIDFSLAHMGNDLSFQFKWIHKKP